jgi:hypothetical protein
MGHLPKESERRNAKGDCIFLAKRLLALAPPNVPATAPTIPATKPMIIPLPESPIARPHRALVTILVMN